MSLLRSILCILTDFSRIFASYIVVHGSSVFNGRPENETSGSVPAGLQKYISSLKSTYKELELSVSFMLKAGYEHLLQPKSISSARKFL